MPQSEEAAAFFYAVYSAVQEIPPGKVTTYGHIAHLVGQPQRPRQVGVCLKHLSEDDNAVHNHNNVPWQRVINAKGIISPRSAAPRQVCPSICLIYGELISLGPVTQICTIGFAEPGYCTEGRGRDGHNRGSR